MENICKELKCKNYNLENSECKVGVSHSSCITAFVKFKNLMALMELEFEIYEWINGTKEIIYK